MRPFIVAALLVAAPALAAPPAPVKEGWDRTAPRVTGAWVRANPVPGRPAAGYFTLAGGSQPDRLVAVTAPPARIEMHSMSMAGGVMKMARLDGVPVPAGASVAFAPGGNHLMVFDLPAGAKSLPMTFVFASGRTVTATAEVRPAGN